ncbi:hypothetical protein DYB32_001686 [Aphanomyces invadans]|uniref:Uncharacterized protein n=1 Tax=Aphanomyces invadans TaxID=157072 RepID=A0A3R6WRN0_9STRA|nr:hypothetical protein DYB32_001686 [Aphanomyces invadans]
MIEMMSKHSVRVEKRTVDLFIRLYARLLAEDPAKMHEHMTWYANHQHVLTSPIPVNDMYVELISRGHVSVAVSLWELCMEDAVLSSSVPRLAAVDALVCQLVRYEQIDAVVDLTRSKFQERLWTSPSAVFATKVMEGHSDRREFHEVLKVHDLLEAKGIVVDIKRYKVLVRNAKVHMELRTGTSTLAPE